MTVRSVGREYVEALLIAVIFATFARTYVVQAFKIPTGSMEENLLVGDHILVNKFVYGPAGSAVERWLLPSREVRRGDVVVFRFPEDPTRDFIKRCVGLPGDRIQIVDKVLYVNDQPVADDGYTLHLDTRTYPDSEFLHADYRYRDNFGPVRVPPDHLFFLGDNRDNSHDSRFWGVVPKELVKGRALLIYWSFASEPDGEPSEGEDRGRLRRLAGVMLDFFGQTRWDRSFHVVR